MNPNDQHRLAKIERRLDVLEKTNGVALTARSHPSNSIISLEAELEQRLIDITEAKDGHGRMILLVSWGNITFTDYPSVHAALKKAYDTLTDSWRLDTAYLPEDTGEEAFWRNVALLTNALRITSTLIRRTQTSKDEVPQRWP